MPIAPTEHAMFNYLSIRAKATAQQAAKHLDIPASTAVSILGRLHKKGLIARDKSVSQERGRPRLPYRIQLPGPVAVLFLDGSQLAGAVFAPSLALLAQVNQDSAMFSTQDEAIAQLDRLLATLLKDAELDKSDLAYVVLGLNAVRDMHGKMTGSVLPWIRDDLGQNITDALGIPVRLEQSSYVLAEQQYLPEPYPDSLLHFRVCAGVSCTVVAFGHPVPGHNGLNNELGQVVVNSPWYTEHICDDGGLPVRLESLCNDTAICRFAGLALEETTEPSMLDPQVLACGLNRPIIEHLWQCWLAGDPLAIQVMDRAIKHMAWGLSLAVNLIDPDMICIDGYVLRDRPEWIDHLMDHCRSYLIYGHQRNVPAKSASATLADQLKVLACQGLRQELEVQCGGGLNPQNIRQIARSRAIAT